MKKQNQSNNNKYSKKYKKRRLNKRRTRWKKERAKTRGKSKIGYCKSTKQGRHSFRRFHVEGFWIDERTLRTDKQGENRWDIP